MVSGSSHVTAEPLDRPIQADGGPNDPEARIQRSWARLGPIGVGGGLLSGLLGVGGGVVMVPSLVAFANVKQRHAHALSLGAIIPISLVSSLVYGAANEVNLLAAALLTVGSVVGARIGARALVGIDENVLKLSFGMFLVGAAGLMVVQP